MENKTMSPVKKLLVFVSMATRISKTYIPILLFNSLVGSAQIIVNVTLPRLLIDELSGAMNADRLLWLTALIVGTNVIIAFLQILSNRLLRVANAFVSNKLNQVMAKKIMDVEYYCLESPHTLDLKERAVFAIHVFGSLANLMSNLAIMLRSAITVLSLMAIMFTLSWILVAALVVLVAISLLIYGSFLSYQVKFFESLIPNNRKYGYYVNLCYDDAIQKDARLYGMTPMIEAKITHFNGEINRWMTGYSKREGMFMGLYGVVNDIMAAGANGYVGCRVVTDLIGKRISIGSFTMYVSAAVSFATAITQLGQSIINIGQMLSYLDPFMEFMSIPDEDSIGNVPFEGEVNSIRFEHVDFTYPGADKPVLTDITFSVEKGEKISIVGLNGAGKTTLIKLLCRLYQPSSGVIYINGRDIFSYEHESYTKAIAAVFQDFRLFAFTVDENISCSYVGSDTQRITDITKQVGIYGKLASLKDGIETLYGKKYDEGGTEFSGGESQKIAIARALYKDSSLIILDEPTSALDPLAEAEIYEKFNSLVGDKTAFYISHRMSSSKFCDRILILYDGRVAAFDTHEHLLADENSLYHKLFMSQAENYAV